MNNALIGYTGFVGSTLLKQAHFNHLYRSTNITDIRHQSFDTVVCAGAPAQKWLANKEPLADKAKIEVLIDHLKTIKCRLFILISTVDVFQSPLGVDETTIVNEENLHPYGLHRRYLEKFVESHFEHYLIVRLPGLIGPGLRKNIIFDFLNQNNMNLIESRNVFQFYPMVNLWSDIQIALTHRLPLIHLTAEPISVSHIAQQGFGLNFTQELSNPLVHYDMKTCHAALFQGLNGYQYTKKESLLAIRAYAQSEPKTLKEVS